MPCIRLLFCTCPYLPEVQLAMAQGLVQERVLALERGLVLEQELEQALVLVREQALQIQSTQAPNRPIFRQRGFQQGGIAFCWDNCFSHISNNPIISTRPS